MYRLTPMYALVIGFGATLMAHLGTGPDWYVVRFTAMACRNAWWMQLLYINNVIPREQDQLVLNLIEYFITYKI